ncbi:MAG TPA: glycosyltransferase family 2 protein [Candidatus Binataceae bacterium]|nr:glycosyltransferase family 2 protein [Candidatus Binataceae bacterium]
MNPTLSLVVPCYNEEGNLRALTERIEQVCAPLGLSYELVITDDCSSDGSWPLLQQLAVSNPHLRAQRLERNCGESAASWAGMRAARGQYIVTIDADLQNDPTELPHFIEALKNYDCVCGSRVKTRAQGDNILKVLTSRAGNWLRNWLSGDQISDSGCTYRAFKRECIAEVRPFRGMHRFLPTLIRMEGYSVGEIAVVNQPRHSGRSHYGFWNRINFLADLLAVRWMIKRQIKPRVIARIPANDEGED